MLQRFLLVLMWPSQPSQIVPFVNAIITAMTNNPNFPNPPGIPVLQADNAAFLKALAACKTKAVGTKETRDAAELKLKTDVQHLMDFAQALVDANTSQAAVMISSSGFKQKKIGDRVKLDVQLKWGTVTGSVVIVVRSAGDHITYFFEYSTDQKAWSSLPPTHHATATVSGLTPSVTYYFRYQTLATKNALGDWSTAYPILVK